MSGTVTEFRYDIEAIGRKAASLGLNKAAIARRAGVTPTTVANVLRRKHSSPGTVKKIAEAVGLQLGDLVVSSDAAGNASRG